MRGKGLLDELSSERLASRSGGFVGDVHPLHRHREDGCYRCRESFVLRARIANRRAALEHAYEYGLAGAGPFSA